ncbi:MAG TPA: SDR family oxidoreductase [Allosphingosinicella sp.]|jgi:3-oxoacyl-[acyl-carrier protein] reductase
MKLGLEGKSVLVTAGSRGIGLACALGFHAEGARVTISGRDQATLDVAAQLMPGCATVAGDVTVPDDIERMVSAAGPVDILVNNAGGPPAGLFDSLSDDQWQQAFELTLMSAIRASRLVLPHMRGQRWGRIVNISSSGVKQPVPGLTLSNSIRMGVLGWAKTLSAQVGPDGVTVNTVCPGWTDTDRVSDIVNRRARDSGASPDTIMRGITSQIPLGRLGRPEEIANLVLFLGSQAAAYITGTAIQVDGGAVQGYA